MVATVRAAAVRAMATSSTPAGMTTKSAAWCSRPRNLGLTSPAVSGASFADRASSFIPRARPTRSGEETMPHESPRARARGETRGAEAVPYRSGDGANVRSLRALLALRHVELDLLV